ncbi:MAG: lamin tail domain-containing protein [Sphingobacteriales bacterium]|nr:MAG: lamin tail domain-containing protein [Sphingobacteriales bacterium]
MRKFLVFLIFLGVNCAYAQLNDNFTDGNFTNNPTWQGDVADFTVNATNQLQTVVNTAAKTVNLNTANTIATNAKWNFFVKMAFDPSSSNQLRVYLTADNADFNAPLNGYYLLIGESGATDSYDLFKQTGTTSVKIIDGAAKTRTNINEVIANIEITRTSNGLWDLKTDNTGGTNYTSEGTVTDNNFTTSAFFGVQCKYTATRSNLFYFDDFLVTTLANDVTPPTLSDLLVVNESKIQLTFNEALGVTEASNINNYKITPGNILPKTATVNGAIITLDYANPIITGNYSLNIANIKDIKGNTITAPINKAFSLADVTPPTLNTLTLIGNNKIELVFNEALGLTEASNLNNYKIAPNNILPKTVTVNGALVTLDYATAFSTGNFTLNITNIKDATGNAILLPISKLFTVSDITPPTLSNFILVGDNKIELTFNEAVGDTEASNINNYKITPGNILPKTATVNGAVVTLDYATGFNTGNYSLSIINIKDTKGNTITQPISSAFNYIKPYITKVNDIVINEIFADPSPIIGLPDAEFIEFWNTTALEIPLKGFKYGTLTSTYTFDKETIKPNEYLILCARADTSSFKPYGRTFGITFPTLTNGGSQLKLVNPLGTIISSVSYNDTWYKDAVKKDGGYSLELIDQASVCKPSQNYSASNSATGGTPGKVNSIYLSNKTSTPLLLNSAILKDELTITLTFNRGLDSLQASVMTNYLVNNGVGNPIYVNVFAPDFSTVDLVFSQALTKNRTYTVNVKNLTDCGATSITGPDVSFFYPGDIVKNDVLINEILYDPKGDDADFIELYNNSDKVLDFKDLFITTVNTKNELGSIKQISATSVIFQPKSYWVITPDPDNIKLLYTAQKPNNFVKLTGMAAFVNTEGKVVILNKANQTIDSLSYNDKMHFALLKETEGVSLERSSFTNATNATGNFKSAAASVGYATPTYKNSQAVENMEATDEVSLASETFSPDNDGFEDVLRILYKFDKPNYVANVTVYNSQGTIVKKLVKNQTLATAGELQWDGLDETGAMKAKTGIYIVYVELYNLDGDIKKFRKTAVLASKF